MSNTDNIWGTTLIERQTGDKATVADIVLAAKGIFGSLQEFEDDTAAGVGGLSSGELYHTTATGTANGIVTGDLILKVKA